MIQEILSNIMESGEEPDLANAVIRDMTEHHRIIRVSTLSGVDSFGLGKYG